MSLLQRLLGLLGRNRAVEASAPPPADAEGIDFRMLAESSGDIICRINSRNEAVYVSPSVEHVLGWRPEEVTQRAIDFIHPDDIHLVIEANQRVFSGGEAAGKLTYRMIRRDGEVVWMESNARQMRNPDGTPGDVIIVVRDVSDRIRLEEELRRLSFTDALTGLSNRRAFDEALNEEWRRTVRHGSCISLLMLDLDRFKSFNDLYGHQAGDDCLRVVAASIRSLLRRPGDIAARYGGEEIVVILPDTDSNGAVAMAEKIRAAIAALDVHHSGASGIAGIVTVSIGVATAFARTGGTIAMPEGLLLAADGALYKAKQGGRNRVVATVLIASCDGPKPAA